MTMNDKLISIPVTSINLVCKYSMATRHLIIAFTQFDLSHKFNLGTKFRDSKV